MDPLQKAIVWNVIEEDFSGLWSFIWEFNTIYPQKNFDAARVKVKSALVKLFKKGLIEFFWDNELNQAPIPVPFHTALKFLEDAASYEVPNTLYKKILRVGATDKAYKIMTGQGPLSS